MMMVVHFVFFSLLPFTSRLTLFIRTNERTKERDGELHFKAIVLVFIYCSLPFYLPLLGCRRYVLPNGSNWDVPAMKTVRFDDLGQIVDSFCTHWINIHHRIIHIVQFISDWSIDVLFEDKQIRLKMNWFDIHLPHSIQTNNSDDSHRTSIDRVQPNHFELDYHRQSD